MNKIDQAAARMAKTARVPPRSDFWKTTDEYRAKFNDLPTLVGVITADNTNKMKEVLQDAIKNDKPLTDAEWYKALGLKPPPSDALT